ncbi:MAG: VanZ family protein [Planctomycetota bacterium]|jgi:VanZ family protein
MPDPALESEPGKNGISWGGILWLWAPPLLYTLLIFLLSSIRVGKPPQIWSLQDKLAHFVEYGILTALIFRALRARLAWWAAAAAAFLTASLLGSMDELYQSTIPKRTADVFDAVADSAGALVGALAASGLSGLLARRRIRADEGPPSEGTEPRESPLA